MSDLNNLRKFITTTMYNYVIKEIVELASKSPWVTGKASGIQAGMLGEQGGNSRLGKQSGDEEKKEDEEKIEGAKNIFFVCRKNKKIKQTQVETN